MEQDKKTEKKNEVAVGFICILLGFALFLIHGRFSGSNVKDIVSGVMLGGAIISELAGVFILAKKGISKKANN